MTPKEQAKRIEEIYDEAMQKLEALNGERKSIVANYIKELETQKLSAVRATLLENYK